MKQQLLLFLFAFLPLIANADPVEIDGIYYNLIAKGLVAEVTNSPNGYYSSNISIPETVIYEEANYSVKYIGDHAFSGCIALTSVTIPTSIIKIGLEAFGGCTNLTSITIPNSVSSIDDNAFAACTSLTSLIIPNSVTTIGNSTFGGCVGLTSVTIGKNVTKIGLGAFQGCSALTSVHISDIAAWCNIIFGNSNDDNPLFYAKHLYLNDEEIQNLEIPNTVNSVCAFAFSGCNGLISITIPNSVTKIGSGAFAYCSGLTDITIPNSITSISHDTFYECSGLTSITIPDSVTNIGAMAFYGCSRLSNITIPNSVTNIRSMVFAECPEISDVYCYATNVPTTNKNTFEGSFIEYATLHVPAEAIEAYSNTAPWSSFGNIIAIVDGDEFHDLTIDVINALGKVSYGTIDITNSQQTFNVMNGSDAELTFTPNDGYRLASVTVDGVDKTNEVENGKLTISNISANVTVEVIFMTAGETATVAIGSTGMATYCSTSDLDFSDVEGLKAYIGAGFNRTTGKLTMLEVTDVPAGTGLIVKGNAGTYEVPVKASASVYANLLEGVTTATNISKTADGYTNYILGNGANGVGFYLVSSAGGSLSAGKAYLRIPTVLAGSRSVIDVEFSEGVTGIDDAGAGSDVSGDFFTLSGQRLEGKPTKAGMYVKNGRVVIIK